MRKYLLLLMVLLMAVGTASTAIAQDWDVNRDFSMTQNPNGAWSYINFLDDGFNWAQYYDNTYTWAPGMFYPYYEGAGVGYLGYWGNPPPPVEQPWNVGMIFYWYGDPTPLSGNPDYYSGDGNQWWQKGHVRLHPANLDGYYYPAIRWTAPDDMVIQVHALFYGCEWHEGCGVYARANVLLNGNMYNWDGSVPVSHALFQSIIQGNHGCPALGIPETNEPGNHAEYNATITVYKGDKLDFAVDGQGWNGCDLSGLDATITKVGNVTRSTTHWDLADDYGRGGNPNGQWTYGVYVQDADPFTFFVWPACTDWPDPSCGPLGSVVSWSYFNTNAYGNIYYNTTDADIGPLGGTLAYIPSHKVSMQPACNCSTYAPVVRWTAPRDMKVAVDARFYGEQLITSTGVYIQLNGDMTDGPVFTGNVLLSGVIDGEAAYEPLGIAASGTTNTVTYHDILSLQAGDKLDFTVTCGPNWCDSDMTGLDVTIDAACVNTPSADMDGDHDVDQDDFGTFQACYTGASGTGPLPPECMCVDKAGSAGTITVEDLNAFLDCWTGPAVEWTQALKPDCLP